MTLSEYVAFVESIRLYPERNRPFGLFYTALKLAGEAGEIADKVGKAIRDDSFYAPKVFSSFAGETEFVFRLTSERRAAIALELGDVLWYCVALAAELSIPIEHVLEMNVEKLQSRHARGTARGDGDNR